ncbi:hypothetical protein PVK06_026322 [Gossypium arboreum]|uniref:RNase H type-1 domain-containing protein n=1 Tax=Gossypium arboreum TaxID=29729 RepID=A0ABR0NXC8_GOSAR|nr:hypothetical protein PVK06_026322 [Gossypium arboreum]
MNTLRSIAYWAIWFNRNKIYHKGFRESVHGIIAFIRAYHAEISSMRQASRHANEVEKDIWTPPKDDTIKINFDASFNQHTGRSVSRILVRNKDGLIMAACTFPWENVPDPVMAEARACLQAVTMAKEMGFQDVVVEGDALTVIRKLKSSDDDLSNIRSLIREIKGRACRFKSLSLEYILREANHAAHGMARVGRQYESPQYWIKEAPIAVVKLIDRERRRDVNGQ